MQESVQEKREEQKVEEVVAEEVKAEEVASEGEQTVQADEAEQAEVVVEPTVEELLEAQKAETAKFQDLYMRAMAEMENSRRRAEESVEKAHKFGVEKFAKNMLPVVDSLEKALEVAGTETNPIIEGVQVTLRQMIQALDASGMKEINPVGEKFDPSCHQAITMVPAVEGQTSGNVAQVFQRGWMIHGRVLRAALVSVVQ